MEPDLKTDRPDQKGGVDAPPRRLVRLYGRMMVGAMTLFVIGLGAFSVHLYHLEEQQALEALLGQFGERVERVAAGADAIEDFVAQFSDQATRFMAGGWKLLEPSEMWSQLKSTPAGHGFEFPDTGWGPDGEPSGNLITIRDPDEWTDLDGRMAALSVALQSYQKAGHRERDNIVLSYFFSADKDILGVYPYVSASEFLRTASSNDLASALAYAWEPFEASVDDNSHLLDGFWTAPYEDRAGKGMMVSRVDPIHYAGKLVGLVGADVTLQLIHDYIDPLDGPAGNLALVTNDAQLIARTRGPSLTGDELKDIQSLIRSRLSNDLNVKTPAVILSEKNFWVLIDGVPGMAWTMVYAVRNRDIAAFLFQERFALIVIVVAVASFFIVGYFVISRRFIDPALQAEQALLDSLEKEAELATLRSQINPHFLFNSLNTVRALVRNQPDLARDAVTRLSNILRVALESGRRTVIPLEIEMNVVRSYLALEGLRFDDRLAFEIDQEAGLEDARVPPMLVQTLVENAVKHGIGAQGLSGAVEVRIRSESGALIVTVTNPGRIRSESRSTRVGLRNARERLELLFGDEASVTLEETADGRVKAEARLPLVKGEEETSVRSS
jgi:sensor histidine kinase YesM